MRRLPLLLLPLLLLGCELPVCDMGPSLVYRDLPVMTTPQPHDPECHQLLDECMELLDDFSDACLWAEKRAL